jgi:hypothetical protein
MDSKKELAYSSLSKEICEFLEKESTKKMISEYADIELAKSHIKKHIHQSGNGAMSDIQKILDELL